MVLDLAGLVQEALNDAMIRITYAIAEDLDRNLNARTEVEVGIQSPDHVRAIIKLRPVFRFTREVKRMVLEWKERVIKKKEKTKVTIWGATVDTWRCTFHKYKYAVFKPEKRIVKHEKEIKMTPRTLEWFTQRLESYPMLSEDDIAHIVADEISRRL